MNTEETKSPKKLVVVTIIVLALVGGGVFLFKRLGHEKPPADPAQENPAEVDGGDPLEQERKTPPTIGVLLQRESTPGQKAFRNRLEKQFFAINSERNKKSKPPLKLLLEEAGDRAEESQTKKLEAMIGRRPDVIIIQPEDAEALKAPLEQTNREGIPVVACAGEVVGGNLATFVTSDNYQAGYLAGEYLLSTFPADKKLRVVVFSIPDSNPEEVKLTGFTDALEEGGKEHEVLKRYDLGKGVHAKDLAKSLLEDLPDKDAFDAVFAVNDSLGATVQETLFQAGRKDIFLAFADGDPAFADLICKEEVKGISSAQFFGEIGATCMRVAYDIFLKNPVPREMLVPAFPITPKTCDRYKGWEAPIPDRFEKPWKSKKPVWRGEIKRLPKED